MIVRIKSCGYLVHQQLFEPVTRGNITESEIALNQIFLEKSFLIVMTLERDFL